MTTAIIIVLIIFIILMIIKYAMLKLEKSETPKDEKLPYEINKSILTDKELKFYNSLKPITDKNNLTILCKVRIADIVSVPKGTKDYIRWFNYISSKHLDFVVCNSEMSPIYAVEVDDKTHERADRVKRDEFVNKIFIDKNVKLLRYNKWTKEQLETDFSSDSEKNCDKPQQ